VFYCYRCESVYTTAVVNSISSMGMHMCSDSEVYTSHYGSVTDADNGVVLALAVREDDALRGDSQYR
jgi:hypothetical protein